MLKLALAICFFCPAAAAIAAQCTFWVGVARQERRFLGDNYPYEDTQRTTILARLREGRRVPVAKGTKIELVHAGSSIEGSLDAKLSGKGGNVSSGRGKAGVSRRMIDTYVLVDKAGRPIEYVLDLDPDAGTSYPTTTTWSSGNVTTSNHPFQPIEIGAAPDTQKPRLIESRVMQGNYDLHDSPTQFVKASWNLKRMTAPCDRPPGIPDIGPEKKPKCQSADVQRALMDPIWNQRQVRARQLDEDFKELADANQRLQDNLSAWRAAIPICGIEEIGMKIAERFLSKYPGERGEFTEVLGKMATGDLSYMVKEKPYANTLGVLKNLNQIFQAAVGAGDPAAMEEQLADCKGLPEDLKNAAKAFVDAYAEVKALMPKVQKEVNDIRSDDQKYWDQWHKYYQACLDYAECVGTSAADCPEPPAEPSGPIPGQQTTLPTAPPRREVRHPIH